jgi:hypothetical protein
MGEQCENRLHVTSRFDIPNQTSSDDLCTFGLSIFCVINVQGLFVWMTPRPPKSCHHPRCQMEGKQEERRRETENDRIDRKDRKENELMQRKKGDLRGGSGEHRKEKSRQERREKRGGKE